MRIKLTLSYIGTSYSGWQLQENAPTVQGEIEKALFSLYGEKIRVTGVGRTDEGVHALEYVCHYDAVKQIDNGKIVLGLNRFLPQDVSVLSAQEVPNDFDARRSAVCKTYVYRFYVSRARLPLLDRTFTQLYKMPDVAKMTAASRLFVGEHDFSAFARTGSNLKGTVRKVISIEIKKDENIISVYICGNAFLYNMVRNIVGALLWVGNGKLTEDDLVEMLETHKKTKYYKTLVSKGLTFVNAEY